jgi:hypothetical protein
MCYGAVTPRSVSRAARLPAVRRERAWRGWAAARFEGQAANPARADDATCRTHRHRIRCDDGRTFRHHGNRITDDDGNVWRRRPNGDIVDPEGEVWRRRGNRLVGPNGETCRKSGHTVRCSD